MDRDKIKVLYKKYELTENDVFKHKHYLIITRQGIDKIQAKEKIFISYEAVKVEPEFCVVKASAKKDNASIETFGSAKYGGKTWDADKKKWNEKGNTTTWYVMEMAEKRAMSRAVLKLTGFYELGVFGEDESDFTNNGNIESNNEAEEVSRIVNFIANAKTKKDVQDIRKTLSDSLLSTFAQELDSRENELKE